MRSRPNVIADHSASGMILVLAVALRGANRVEAEKVSSQKSLGGNRVFFELFQKGQNGEAIRYIPAA